MWQSPTLHTLTPRDTSKPRVSPQPTPNAERRADEQLHGEALALLAAPGRRAPEQLRHVGLPPGLRAIDRIWFGSIADDGNTIANEMGDRWVMGWWRRVVIEHDGSIGRRMGGSRRGLVVLQTDRKR